MMLIEKFDELLARLEDEEAIKVLRIMESLSIFTTQVSRANITALFDGARNEADDKKVAEEYELSLDRIKEINRISNIHLDKNIYEGTYDKISVMDFVKQLANESFDNRTI